MCNGLPLIYLIWTLLGPVRVSWLEGWSHFTGGFVLYSGLPLIRPPLGPVRVSWRGATPSVFVLWRTFWLILVYFLMQLMATEEKLKTQNSAKEQSEFTVSIPSSLIQCPLFGGPCILCPLFGGPCILCPLFGGSTACSWAMMSCWRWCCCQNPECRQCLMGHACIVTSVTSSLLPVMTSLPTSCNN